MTKVYVQTMGAIWALSKKKFEKLKADLKKGDVDLDKYGPMIVGSFHDLEDLQQQAREGE